MVSLGTRDFCSCVGELLVGNVGGVGQQLCEQLDESIRVWLPVLLAGSLDDPGIWRDGYARRGGHDAASRADMVAAMSDHPEIEDTVAAVFAAIRLPIAEHDGLTTGSRAQIHTLFEALIAKHGQRAGPAFAFLLAEAAAAGWENLAVEVGDPVGQILDQYERSVRTNLDFDLLTAEQFPEDPEER